MEDEERIIGRGRFLELRDRGGWEYAHRTVGRAVVAIVAVDDADRVVLVDQFRPAVGCRVLELPAGLVGDEHDDERLEEAARRELLEETGFEARSWTNLVDVTSSSGLTDERVRILVAEGLERVGEGGGVDGERITIHLVDVATLGGWLSARARAGDAIDSRVFAVPMFLRMAKGGEASASPPPA